jgi:hypothetical protein
MSRMVEKMASSVPTAIPLLAPVRPVWEGLIATQGKEQYIPQEREREPRTDVARTQSERRPRKNKRLKK